MCGGSGQQAPLGCSRPPVTGCPSVQHPVAAAMVSAAQVLLPGAGVVPWEAGQAAFPIQQVGLVMCGQCAGSQKPCSDGIPWRSYLGLSRSVHALLRTCSSISEVLQVSCTVSWIPYSQLTNLLPVQPCRPTTLRRAPLHVAWPGACGLGPRAPPGEVPSTPRQRLGSWPAACPTAAVAVRSGG